MARTAAHTTANGHGTDVEQTTGDGTGTGNGNVRNGSHGTNGHGVKANGKKPTLGWRRGREAVDTGYEQLQPGQKPTWRGLTIERRFTRPGVDPYDTVEWETREAVITNEHGKAVFEQRDLEIPKSWSQLATQVVASKYFRGHLGTPERERSAKQMIDRVANTITDWGIKDAYFATDEDADAFRNELKDILLKQRAAFNSPVWFNVGIDARPQCSACQPYDALVSTPEGMIPIGRLVDDGAVGREVYDASGVTRVVAVKNNGRKPVWRIRLANGNFVEATPDHVVKAVRERRTAPEWLRLDQLEVGMRMHLHPHRARVAAAARSAIVVGTPAGGMPEPGPLAGEMTDTDSVDPQAEVMRAEAALAGWLQADGFVGQYAAGTNRSLTIEFQVANDDEYAWVMSNIDIALPLVHLKVREADTVATKVQRIRIYGEVVRDFVERWGLLRRGTEIRVPERLWTASYDEVCAYLRSIFQADGYVTVRRESDQESARVEFAVIGERWAEDVQLLLNSIGIYSRRMRKHEKRANRHDLHEVSIAVGSERARFAELVGFVEANKQARLLEGLLLRDLKAVPNVREERIVAIEELGVQEVYDIQTESGEYLSNNVAVHNCFINSVDDTMESILTLAKTEGMLFKFGSGAGSNLSTIRSSKETLRGGGEASGPVSFMKGFDAFAGVIKSGGKTRRAAKMVILNVGHPDVEEFIDCKLNEEKKAWALIDAGYDGNFNGGEAYASVFFQNSNNSVRVTDEFMQAVETDGDWTTHAVTTGEPVETTKARHLLNKMAQAAWVCGDPGIQYHDNVNRWNPVAATHTINASNPCSEYMHIDDSACNLASLNLMTFVGQDGEFDVEAYKHAVRIVFTAQEIIVDNASYPTPRIGENSRDFRPIGIGYANLGALLMNRGLAYDSDAGRAYAAGVTALMQSEAALQSARIARDQGGAFVGYAPNREPYLKVMAQHRDAAYRIDRNLLPTDMVDSVLTGWDEVIALGERSGFRNSQLSVLAPTGTIAFMMDCDTTGVEPDIALIKYKRLVGGGYLKIVNQTVPNALRRLGYDAKQTEEIVAWIDEHETIEGAPHLTDDHLDVFDCAFKPANGTRSIHYNGHLKMMAAVQPFISGAISKTVNMPEASTADEIAKVYVDGWKLGLKAIAVYRDNSKRSQPLNMKKEGGDAASKADAAAVASVPTPPQPYRRRLPDERASITHKFNVGGHEGYLTIGLYEDGTPGEIFLRMAKEGSTISGLMDSFATAVSLALQYGVPLKDLVNKFSHLRFEPAGFTTNRDIPMAKSLVDYIFRYMATKFMSQGEKDAVGIINRQLTLSEATVVSGEAPGGGPAAPQTGASATPPAAQPRTDSAPARSAGGGEAAASQAAAGVPIAVSKGEPDDATLESVAAEVVGAGAAVEEEKPASTLLDGLKIVAQNSEAKAREERLAVGQAPVVFDTADSPACTDCGSIMVRNGSCYKCINCGATSGCS